MAGRTCERCGAASGKYVWCQECHEIFNLYLKDMNTGFVRCRRCDSPVRPGVLLFTRSCCPRCGCDLSDDYRLKALTH